MANYWALSAGLWNNVSNWLTGTTPGEMAGALPNSLDYVYTNGKIITVNVSARVFAISNASSENSIEGGHFYLNSGVSLSALVLGGGADNQYTVQFLSASPHQATIVGNLCAVKNTVANPGIILHNGTGTLNVRGSLIPSRNNGGSTGATSAFITNLSTGILNLFGNYSGSNPTGTLLGIRNNSNGTINILGNLSGVSVSRNANACFNFSSGTVNITGSVVGRLTQPGFGPGARGVVNNQASSRVNIVGNVFENGAWNGLSSIMTVRGNCVGGGGIYGTGAAASVLYAPTILNDGILTIIGNCIGSSSRRNVGAIVNIGTSLSPATINVYGNVIASNGSAAICIRHMSFGEIKVYGDVVGGQGSGSLGITIESSGPVSVFGDTIGGPGTGAHGILNTVNTGRVYVQRAVGNSWGSLAFVSEVPALSNLLIGNSFGLINNSLSGLCYYSDLACGLRGNFPIGGTGSMYLSSSKDTKVSFPTDNFGPRVTTVSLCANSNFNPISRNVRENVDYEIVDGIPLVEDPANPGLSNKYGTLRMPAPGLVAIGAPTDDTVGTATFENPEKIWDVPIGEFLNPITNELVWYEGLNRRTFNWTYGERIRYVATLNALSAVIKSLNNQPR